MTPEARTIYNSKMGHNVELMRTSAASIRNSLVRLEKAIEMERMDEMHTSLKDIVDNAIGCRSRLQFVRGVYAACSDMSRGSPA